MTAPEKTAHTEAAAPKVFLGWSDDDALVRSTEMEIDGPSDALFSDFGGSSFWPSDDRLLRLISNVSWLPTFRWQAWEIAAAAARSWSVPRTIRALVPQDIYGDVVPTTYNFDDALELATEAGGVKLFIAGRCDFHSAPLADLINVELTISEVKHAVREALDSGFRSAGLDSAHDTHGEAYSDDAADYPPLSRNYANVKVRISGEDKVKPRRYTDEDHQAWRP